MGLYMTEIEEGSCNGEKACYKVTGSTRDGVGVDERGYSLVGAGSCVGHASCSYFMGELLYFSKENWLNEK